MFQTSWTNMAAGKQNLGWGSGKRWEIKLQFNQFMMIKQVKIQASQTQTDHQSPELGSLTFNFSQGQNKSISMTKTSEMHSTLYEAIMKSVSIMPVNELKQKLKSQGIEYDLNKINHQFQKSCIKTDWESVVYDIKYGKFQMNFRLLRVNFSQNVVCRSFYNKGSFGEIWKFDYYEGKKQYVLKNILMKNNQTDSIDMALREVFMAKLFSSLEIGPKFSQIFQYDAILYDKSLQYAMQFCNINFTKQQLQKQLKQKQLLKGLSIIHNLNICHKDIKYANVGWSPSYNKFIFLDYNFTEIIREPTGYKTLTKFTGTYPYSSPEMKKCYLLKKQLFVDMYYNDLFCLQVTWKEMSQNYERKQKFQLFQQYWAQTQNKSNQFLHLQEKDLTPDVKQRMMVNDCLVKYFQIKMAVFINDTQKIKKLIEKQTVLVETFKRVMYNHSIDESTGNQIDQQKNQLYLICCSRITSKPRQLPLQILQLDSILATSEIHNASKIKKGSLFTKIIEISQSQSIFQVCWMSEAWRQEMFFFVDVYSNPSCDTRDRKKLIQKICKKISTLKNTDNLSETLKIRQVLLYYFEFFEQKGNLEVLQTILGYFVLMDDEYNCARMQDIILQKLKAQKKWYEYFNMNLMIFLGKFVLDRKNHIVDTNKTLNNLSNLLKISQQAVEGSEILQRLQKHIQPTIDQMKSLKNVRFYYCQQFTTTSLDEKLKIYLHNTRQYLNKDIITIIEKIIPNRYLENFLRVSNIQNNEYCKMDHIYLQKYIFKVRVQHALDFLTKNNVLSLLKSQEFTKQFPTILHNSVLTQISSIKRKQIFDDYYILGKNQKYMCNLYYFQASLRHKSDLQIQSMNAQLDELRLEQIKTIDDLADLQVGLMGLMTSLLTKTKTRQQICPDKLKLMCQKVSFFLQLCLHISLNQSCNSCSRPILKIINEKQVEACQSVFQNNRKFLQFLLFQLMQKTDKTIDIILKMLQKNQKKFAKKRMIVHLLCRINRYFSSQVQKKWEQVIIELAQFHIQPTFELFLIVTELFQMVLMIYVNRNQYEKAMEIARKFCAQIHSRKLPIALPSFLGGIKPFLQSTSHPNVLKQMLQKQTSNKIHAFASFPMFTYFIGILYLNVSQDLQIQSLIKRRIIIVCIFFLRMFGQGIFRSYKNLLFREAKNLFRFGLKKQALIERHFGSSKKFLIFLQRKIDTAHKKRESSISYNNKQKHVEILNKIRAKVKLFEQNRNQKLKPT